MLTRRDVLRTAALTAVALPVAAVVGRAAGQPKIARIRGVRMALQSASFSFSGLALPDVLKTMQALELTEIDSMSEHIEQFLGAPGIQLPGAGRPGPWTRPAGAAARRSRRCSRRSRSDHAAGCGAQPAGVPGHGPGGARGAPQRGGLEVDLARFRAVTAEFDEAGRIALLLQPELQRFLDRRRDRARHADDQGARHHGSSPRRRRCR